MAVYGGIESGGTKCECAIGTGPDDLRASVTIETTSPGETIGRALEFFRSNETIAALGIGSFGPVDLDVESPTWGYVTTTPKPGWAHSDVAGELARGLGVPVAFDTDVNAAALAEHRWGAAKDLDTFCYITVGTGIGGGGMANGELLHGLTHPEFGHMRIPHDRGLDPFSGSCRYHGDCWEGLASGPALAARWGAARGADPAADDVWQLEARYLALGLVGVISVLSPRRILLGGGVMETPALLPLVRQELVSLLNGYLDVPDVRERLDEFVTRPALGRRAGVLGAIALAADLDS